MTRHSKSLLPVHVLKTKTMPLYNKTQFFYLAAIMIVLSGVLIATSF